jgi:hypothetical protein
MPWLMLAFLLFFTGCSSPQLTVLEDKKIVIDSDRGSVAFLVQKLRSETLSLDGVIISRTLFAAKRSRILVYEQARTLPSYYFHFDVSSSLGIIFESTNVVQIARVVNLGFYAVRLPNGRRLCSTAAFTPGRKCMQACTANRSRATSVRS